MYFSAKRQQYLVDQGYTFKIVQDLVDIADRESTLLQSKRQEALLLTKVLAYRSRCEELDAGEERAVHRDTLGMGNVTEELSAEDTGDPHRQEGDALTRLTGAHY